MWKSAKSLSILLIVWNIVDIVLHIVVDKVEPFRITGNIVAIVAALFILQHVVNSKVKVTLAKVAAFAVLILNIAWAVFVINAIPPLIATILISITLFILYRIVKASVVKSK